MACTNSGRLLIVGGEKAEAIGLPAYLATHDFQVNRAESLEGGRPAFAPETFDVIILDQAPRTAAGDIAYLRSGGRLRPAIVVLGSTAREAEAVLMLELGADDFVPHPLRKRELLSRLKAVLRRQPDDRDVAQTDHSGCTFSGFAFHPKSHRLVLPSGRQLVLSRTEQVLLQMLLDHPGSVIAREQFDHLEAAREKDRSRRNMDVAISRLRSRISAYGAPIPIRSIRGRGYLLDSEVRLQPG